MKTSERRRWRRQEGEREGSINKGNILRSPLSRVSLDFGGQIAPRAVGAGERDSGVLMYVCVWM